MSRLPIAIVGAGGMARRYLKGLKLLYESDFCNVDLAGIYDLFPEKAEAVADEAAALLGVRPRVLAGLAGSDDIGGVVLTTDAGSHHSVGAQCLAAGYHVLIEKPLALTVRGCNLVIEAARRAGKVLSVAENYRRDPMNRLVQALIRDGAIGQPRLMIESRIGGENKLFITPWRHQKNSGTLVLDTGVHNADILQFYLGEVASVYGEGRLFEPVRYARQDEGTGYVNWTAFYDKTNAQQGAVTATGEDALFGFLHFKNGAIGQWIFNYAAYCPQELRRVVYGSKGTLVCPGDRNGRPVQLQLGETQAVADAGILAYAPSYRLSPLAAHLFGDERPWHYEMSYPEVDSRLLAIEIQEFAECAAQNKDPEVTGEVARRDVALVNAVFESGKLARPVTLDEVEQVQIDGYQREIDEHYGLL